MLFPFKTGSYFLIILNKEMEITFESHLFSAFLICLALLYGTKSKTIFQKCLKNTKLEKA